MADQALVYILPLDGSLDDTLNDIKGACAQVGTFLHVIQSLSSDAAIRCACGGHGGCRQWGTVGRYQVEKSQLPLDLQSARTAKRKRSLAGVAVLVEVP